MDADLKIAVVVPVGPGREANLNCVLSCLDDQTRSPDCVVIVSDEANLSNQLHDRLDRLGYYRIELPKHHPGMEQPRNIGVRVATCIVEDLDYVAFLDSDVVVRPNWLDLIEHALEDLRDHGGERPILVCPYDWCGPGDRPDTRRDFFDAADGLLNDPRWAMFNAHDYREVFRADLSKGLGCFSGNLAWPVDEFERVGGFWAEIHHGRCEDGELGLRAVAMDVPIALLREARGWHLHHPVNTQLALERNSRDVPMLNERHPWVERGAVFMVDRDGKAFDVRCRCGEQVPTIQWWEHAAGCSSLASRQDKDAIPVG